VAGRCVNRGVSVRVVRLDAGCVLEAYDACVVMRGCSDVPVLHAASDAGFLRKCACGFA
jgi:hypothetical protein